MGEAFGPRNAGDAREAVFQASEMIQAIRHAPMFTKTPENQDPASPSVNIRARTPGKSGEPNASVLVRPEEGKNGTI
jgi:hypothetical protein